MAHLCLARARGRMAPSAFRRGCRAKVGRCGNRQRRPRARARDRTPWPRGRGRRDGHWRFPPSRAATPGLPDSLRPKRERVCLVGDVFIRDGAVVRRGYESAAGVADMRRDGSRGRCPLLGAPTPSTEEARSRCCATTRASTTASSSTSLPPSSTATACCPKRRKPLPRRRDRSARSSHHADSPRRRATRRLAESLASRRRNPSTAPRTARLKIAPAARGISAQDRRSPASSRQVTATRADPSGRRRRGPGLATNGAVAVTQPRCPLTTWMRACPRSSCTARLGRRPGAQGETPGSRERSCLGARSRASVHACSIEHACTG